MKGEGGEGEREMRGHLMNPLKRLQKIWSQNAIKVEHKNRFSHNSKCPLQKNLKTTDCSSRIL
jgi:hypothetical protein